MTRLLLILALAPFLVMHSPYDRGYPVGFPVQVPDSTALVIIDIQNDYFEGGAYPLEGSVEAATKAGMLLSHFREYGMPVVFIKHVSTNPEAAFFRKGTYGVNIHKLVKPGREDMVISKHFPNSFRETRLQATLDSLGIRELVICGMMTHMCVDATVRAAADKGYACSVVSDACATRALVFEGDTVSASQVHHAFLAALNGSYAKVTKTSDILIELRLDE